MGDRAKGRDKGAAKKTPKVAKPGRRPHEQRQQQPPEAPKKPL